MSSKGPEVHGDVKGLVESGDHVAEHGLEGGVVGAVRHVQDGRHLPRRVRLHLLEQGLQVDALEGKSNHGLTLLIPKGKFLIFLPQSPPLPPRT